MYESYRCSECGCLFDRSEEGASVLYCPACNERLDAEAQEEGPTPAQLRIARATRSVLI